MFTMNLHSLFCCFVQLFFHLHTKHETSFTNNLSRCQNYASISPDRKIFIEFAPPCIGTKICQTLLHVREGQDQFSINNVELIAINQLVLVKGFKVMYQVIVIVSGPVSNHNVQKFKDPFDLVLFILRISPRKYYLIFNYCLPPSFSHSVEWN